MKSLAKVPFLQRAGFQEFIEECVRRHSLEPSVSPQDYLVIRRADLSIQVAGKSLLYLDTNHWINLRHVLVKDRKMLPSYVAMSELLEQLRRQGKILCPVTDTLFEELMRQSNPITRSASAQIMDALSGGICLLNWIELVQVEWFQHVHRVLHATPEPQISIFTKSGNLGSPGLAAALGLSLCNAPTLAKVYLDIRWKMTFEDCQSWPGWTPRPTDATQKILDTAAMEKIALKRDGLSFDQTRKASMGGWISALWDDFSRKLPELCHGVPGTPEDHMNRIRDDLIHNPRTMPSIQVLSGLDAAMLLSTRELKANDTYDVMHAAVAVPYCDSFFCDKYIASVLSTKPLEFDEVYDTKILSRPEEINAYLSQLI